MSNNWIYIGADIDKQTRSKIGKTTIGLEIRHRSSHNTDFFIYTAYNILEGDVHKIEPELIKYLEYTYGCERRIHLSTGSKSEWFNVNPYEMEKLVELFITTHYSSSVTYDHVTKGVSRVQCAPEFYKIFRPQVNTILDEGSEHWFDVPEAPLPKSLGMSKDKYFTGNQAEHEIDLGDGNFVDLETGMHGYRDEEGNVYWQQ